MGVASRERALKKALLGQQPTIATVAVNASSKPKLAKPAQVDGKPPAKVDYRKKTPKKSAVADSVPARNTGSTPAASVHTVNGRPRPQSAAAEQPTDAIKQLLATLTPEQRKLWEQANSITKPAAKPTQPTGHQRAPTTASPSAAAAATGKRGRNGMFGKLFDEAQKPVQQPADNSNKRQRTEASALPSIPTDSKPAKPAAKPAQKYKPIEITSCKQCAQPFTYTPQEQAEYATRDINTPPVRCANCRKKRKDLRADYLQRRTHAKVTGLAKKGGVEQSATTAAAEIPAATNIKTSTANRKVKVDGDMSTQSKKPRKAAPPAAAEADDSDSGPSITEAQSSDVSVEERATSDEQNDTSDDSMDEDDALQIDVDDLSSSDDERDQQTTPLPQSETFTAAALDKLLATLAEHESLKHPTGAASDRHDLDDEGDIDLDEIPSDLEELDGFISERVRRATEADAAEAESPAAKPAKEAKPSKRPRMKAPAPTLTADNIEEQLAQLEKLT